jgi:hypothetical protein
MTVIHRRKMLGLMVGGALAPIMHCRLADMA